MSHTHLTVPHMGAESRRGVVRGSIGQVPAVGARLAMQRTDWAGNIWALPSEVPTTGTGRR